MSSDGVESEEDGEEAFDWKDCVKITEGRTGPVTTFNDLVDHVPTIEPCAVTVDKRPRPATAIVSFIAP